MPLLPCRLPLGDAQGEEDVSRRPSLEYLVVEIRLRDLEIGAGGRERDVPGVQGGAPAPEEREEQADRQDGRSQFQQSSAYLCEPTGSIRSSEEASETDATSRAIG